MASSHLPRSNYKQTKNSVAINPVVLAEWGSSQEGIHHLLQCGGCNKLPIGKHQYACVVGHVTCTTCALKIAFCPYLSAYGNEQHPCCRNLDKITITTAQNKVVEYLTGRWKEEADENFDDTASSSDDSSFVSLSPPLSPRKDTACRQREDVYDPEADWPPIPEADSPPIPYANLPSIPEEDSPPIPEIPNPDADWPLLPEEVLPIPKTDLSLMLEADWPPIPEELNYKASLKPNPVDMYNHKHQDDLKKESMGPSLDLEVLFGLEVIDGSGQVVPYTVEDFEKFVDWQEIYTEVKFQLDNEYM